MFAIHSTSSNRELILSDSKSEYFRVELIGFPVSASTEVWAYTDAGGLNQFFQDLGSSEKPWQGQRSWGSIEGDFRIAATCTPLGSVTFLIELRGLQGAPEEWRVEAGLATEFGQLSQIAKGAETFFNTHAPCASGYSSIDLGQAFLNREEIPGVRFQHNDFVRVVGGVYSGSAGSLVTVLSLEPEPRFVLELESGLDVEVMQSEIQRAD